MSIGATKIKMLWRGATGIGMFNSFIIL